MKRNYYPYVILIFTLFSCGNTLKGKVEYRTDDKSCYGYGSDVDFLSIHEKMDKATDAKSAYIVNTSSENSYEFTIKESMVTNDKIINYTTTKIILSPGDEKWIGCTKYITGDKYYTKEITDTTYFLRWKKPLPVTSKKIVTDSTKLKPRNITIVEFFCTGQRLIKNSKELQEK
jgi:hypothetical protein